MDLYSGEIYFDFMTSIYCDHDKEKNTVEQLDISIVLIYLLCVCRFSHYIKLLGRDKIGSTTSSVELKEYLQSWIYQYCA